MPRFTLMGVLGGHAARGGTTTTSGSCSASSHPASTWEMDDFYPDALPCLARLRGAGYGVFAAGNMPAFVEDDLRAHVDVRRLVGPAGECGSRRRSSSTLVVGLQGPA